MNIRGILHLLTFLIPSYLLFESVLQTDIAPAKNRILSEIAKSQVDKMTDIAAVKSEAKEWVDINRENFKMNTAKAKKRVLIILVLLIVQATIILQTRKEAKMMEPRAYQTDGS